MYALGFLVMLFAQAAVSEEKPLLAAADLAGWVASGAAEAELPFFRSGSLEDLFDGRPETAVLCGEEGRAVFSFRLPRPMPVLQLGLTLGSGGIHRWRAEISGTAGPGGAAVFSPLIPWRYVEGGGRDPVPLPGRITVARLRIVIERLTVGLAVQLHEIEFYTRIPLKEARLEEWPERPRLGSTYRLRPLALDRFGGRIPLHEGVRWKVRPPEILRIDSKGNLTPLRPGKARIRFFFRELASPEVLLLAAQPDPAPSGLKVEPYRTSVSITFEGGLAACRAYALYSRKDGESIPEEPERILGKCAATVSGLDPGTAYNFSIAGLDGHGHPITARSEEVRFRTLSRTAPKLVRFAQVNLLVPVYTKGFDREKIDAILRGFELARLFFFRGSRGRFHLDIQYIMLPGDVPGSDEPGMAAVAADLEAKGALVADHGAVHVVADDPSKNFSGYRFSGGAIGSMGCTADAPYPGVDSGIDYRACWTLVHEFQHTLDSMASLHPSGPQMLYGHFLDNFPLPEGEVFDAGDYYSGQREILRRFAGYASLPPPWAETIEALDSDGDGLPDEDARLPMDEARFGSDPHSSDTDQDGLNDLEEFLAGIYGGSDPLAPDTDGDGIPDGMDPYPLSGFTGSIPRGTPRVGELPCGLLAENLFFSNQNPPPHMAVHASWDPGHLYFAFVADQALRIRIHIDGSGHLGRFESDRAMPRSNAGSEEDPSRTGDVYSGDAALTAAFGKPRLFKGDTAVDGAIVQSSEREGKHILWLAIPAELGGGTASCHLREDRVPGKGLTLKPGRILGLNFTIHPLGNAPEETGEFTGQWSTMFETHGFYDAALTE